ncbi:MAG: right-handed parallel beta-helix repeat-containing protein, partial [Myxococcota bacterium]
GTGAQDDAFCNLPEVVDAIEADEEVVIFLVGGDPYGDDLEIFVPADVAIVGVGSPSVTGHPFSSQSTIRLTDGARLYLSNIRINGNSNYNGIECDESRVSMADVEVGDNGRWGVLVSSPCTVELRRTMVYGNESGGIRMLGGSLTTDNSAIGENGNGLTGPGVRLLFAEFSALYTTIAGNDAFDADSVQCDGDVSGEIRNSIINGTQLQSIDIDCFSLSFEYNAMSSSAFANGTNANIDEYVAAYFTDPSDGDFRIAAPPLTPFGDVAQWVEGDPRFDADGTERPADALGFVGVDEP